MAAGDILSCEVLATGWEAKVIVEGFKDGGAYNFGDIDTDVANAKLTMTVVSEGYNTSGVLGTKTRTVYGKMVRQKAYPSEATAEETENGSGNVELTVVLSDYVYNDDKNGGAGTSGTNPTVTIASGWYTDSGTGGTNAASNAVTELAVTNSSTQDYPKVIARWAVVPYQRFTSSFALEAVAFHRFAESGKPVACVKFTATDGSNTENITATEMSKSAAADSLPCYTASLTASAYTDNAVVTANFIAYPWVGDADSIIDSSSGTANQLTLGPLPLLADSDDDYGVTLACVNTSTGNDTTGVASPTYATANASPCATIRAALLKIGAYNNTNLGRNNANAGIIYLQSTNHSVNGSGNATTDNVWVTVTRDPNVAKADACIAGAPNASLVTARLRLYDLTLVPTGFVLSGAAGRALWLDNVSIAPSTQQATQLASGYDLTYNTHCTAGLFDYPWASYSTGNIPALVRGCSATSVKTVAPAVGYSPRCLLTTTLHHGNALSGRLATIDDTNVIIAYCRDIANPDASNAAISGGTTTGDCAVVCNLLEDTGGATLTMGLWSDNNEQACANVLVWHNTVAGQRSNIGYNDGAVNVVRSNFSIIGNAFQRFATKHDVFVADGTHIGAWAVTYGVGSRSNHQEYTGADALPYHYGIRSTRNAVAGYASDLSQTTAGSGGGVYVPTQDAILRNKIPTAADVVIPWDLLGRPYRAGGAAGAYGGGPSGQRLWSY